jgi:hypothetical protein
MGRRLKPTGVEVLRLQLGRDRRRQRQVEEQNKHCPKAWRCMETAAQGAYVGFQRTPAKIPTEIKWCTTDVLRVIFCDGSDTVIQR